MMCISFTDLLPEAVESLGFAQAYLAFYVGVAFYAAVAFVIPDPDLDSMLGTDSKSES